MSRHPPREMKTASGRSQKRILTAFDYLAITGGVINLLVIGFIVGYWLFR